MLKLMVQLLTRAANAPAIVLGILLDDTANSTYINETQVCEPALFYLNLVNIHQDQTLCLKLIRRPHLLRRKETAHLRLSQQKFILLGLYARNLQLLDDRKYQSRALHGHCITTVIIQYSNIIQVKNVHW